MRNPFRCFNGIATLSHGYGPNRQRDRAQAGAAHDRHTSNAVDLNCLKTRRGRRWRWTVNGRVLDGCMDREEALRGSGRFEPLHLAFASSHRLM